MYICVYVYVYIYIYIFQNVQEAQNNRNMQLPRRSVLTKSLLIPEMIRFKLNTR